jgi:hypothetical protein
MDTNSIIDIMQELEGQLEKHRETADICPPYCWCHWIESAKTSLEIALRVDYEAANCDRWIKLLGETREKASNEM